MGSDLFFVIKKRQTIDTDKTGKAGDERALVYKIEAVDEDSGAKLVIRSDEPLEAFTKKSEIRVIVSKAQKTLKGEK